MHALLLLACLLGEDDSGLTTPSRTTATTTSTPTGSTTSTSTTGTTTTPTVAVQLSALVNPDLVTEVALDLVVTPAAAVRVQCIADGLAAELHEVATDGVVESTTLILRGLLAETDYACAALDATNRMVGGVDVRTGELPAGVPRGSAVDGGSPRLGYTLFNSMGYCDDVGWHYLVIIDPEGNPRWYHELDAALNVAVDATWQPEGTILYGAGDAGVEGSGTVLDLSGNILSQPPDMRRQFHHHLERQSDGNHLGLAYVENQDATSTFKGFAVLDFDPTTGMVTSSWNSQTGVDDGVLQARGESDPFHANWVQRTGGGPGQGYAVSLCAASQVLHIGTSAIDWVFGAGGTLRPYTLDGEQADSQDLPQCQHGPELVDDVLWLFDNGRERSSSRVSAWQIDATAATAHEVFRWERPGWYESVWGDVDVLDDDRILVASGHCACCPAKGVGTTFIAEVDVATGEELWRYDTATDQDGLYRADRIDTCAPFTSRRWCP